MGTSSKRRVLTIILCLLATSAAIHGFPAKKSAKSAVGLDQAFADIGGWKASKLSMAEDIRKSLALDDFIFSRYREGNREVVLYVGYYLTKNKLGAAHSPLVCYPGQGWEIKDVEKTSIRVGEEGNSSGPIEVAVLNLKREDQKEIAVYWFQSYDLSAPDTFRQKLNSLYLKLTNGKEANAFVRVSVPVSGPGKEKEAFETAARFIGVFYPRLISYITKT